jgi:hypothetical protein
MGEQPVTIEAACLRPTGGVRVGLGQDLRPEFDHCSGGADPRPWAAGLAVLANVCPRAAVDGRPLRTIEAAHVQFGAQRSEKFRPALDLKLTVAEAFAALRITQANRA